MGKRARLSSGQEPIPLFDRTRTIPSSRPAADAYTRRQHQFSADARDAWRSAEALEGVDDRDEVIDLTGRDEPKADERGDGPAFHFDQKSQQRARGLSVAVCNV